MPAARRSELGAWLLERTWTDRDPRLWAAIGRIGSRIPAYASVHHVVGATTYCVLGAFQLVPSLRRSRPRWHRLAGRVLVPAGLAAALSGLWMAVLSDLPAHDNTALMWVRIAFGSLMVVGLVRGTLAIVRHDVATHRRWMARATSSLPVPVSPVMRTVESLGATLEMRESTACKSGEVPTISSNIEAVSISSRRATFSR